MFQDVSLNERKDLFSLVVECAGNVGVPADLANANSWSGELVASFGNVLLLEKDDIQATISLVIANFEEERTLDVGYASFHCSEYQALEIYAMILVYIVELKLYDSRGSVLLRSLCQRLVLSESDSVWTSHELSTVLVQKHKEFLHITEKKDQTMRYAKIGAVAVGAGALLVFTAGLVWIFTCTSCLYQLCFIIHIPLSSGCAGAGGRSGGYGNLLRRSRRHRRQHGDYLRRHRGGPRGLSDERANTGLD